MGNDRTIKRTLDNLVSRHGIEKASWLIRALCRQASGTDIAKHMGVTRERARQWRKVFGVTFSTYLLNAPVKAALQAHRIRLRGAQYLENPGNTQRVRVTIMVECSDPQQVQDEVAAFVDGLIEAETINNATFDAVLAPERPS